MEAVFKAIQRLARRIQVHQMVYLQQQPTVIEFLLWTVICLYLSRKEAATNINTNITTTKTHQSSPLKEVQDHSKPRHVSNESLVPHGLNGARDKTQPRVSLAVNDGKQSRLKSRCKTWPGWLIFKCPSFS
jgi:hypothetical protein